MSFEPGDTAQLDAIRNPAHISYKIIGALAWAIVVLCLYGLLSRSMSFLLVARVFALYLLLRFTLIVVFHTLGEIRIQAWNRSSFQPFDPPHEPERVAEPGAVHHVVIIPNYMEPLSILRRTLEALAIQRDARTQLSIVLAMEEREAGALTKAHSLREEYQGRFAHILITLHPADQPDEIAGKGSNQSWAIRQASKTLVEREALPLHMTTLTTCDADSLFHPMYFARLSDYFRHDPNRHERFWYAPLYYHNDVEQSPVPLRLLGFSSGAGRLAELANPLAWPLPASTYSMSYALAHEVGYWDPAVISEDWHMYLRCYFAQRGRIRLIPIFHPTKANLPGGEHLLDRFRQYYTQQLRHAWGAEDVGYIFQQWRRSTSVPVLRKFVCLTKVLHDHLLRSTAWIIVIAGTLTAAHSGQSLLPLPAGAPLRTLRLLVNFIALAGTLRLWYSQRSQCLPLTESTSGMKTLLEIGLLPLLPIMSIFLIGLPGLHAQTKMLLGQQHFFQRTPKVGEWRVAAVEAPQGSFHGPSE
jgi:hypothetical protein